MVVQIAVVYHSGGGHTEALAKALIAGIERVPGITVHAVALEGEQVVSGRFVDSDERLQRLLEDCDGIVMGSPTYHAVHTHGRCRSRIPYAPDESLLPRVVRYMGCVSAVLKAWMEWSFRTAWLGGRWKDKWATGFTNSASQSGDKLNTLMDLVVYAAQMAMVWVPHCEPPGNNLSTKSVDDINRLGSWLGVMSQSNGDQAAGIAPPASDCLTAERHGARFARMLQHWKREGDYVTERVRAD